MVQKSNPYINKTGYSMFWNSMWDSKNNYSKNLQKDFFLKSFINFFFSDFIQNQFIFKFNFLKLNNYSVFFKNYNLNFLNKDKKHLNYYLNNNFNTDIYISKIWLFKYQNWVILYFFIFSKINSYFFKKTLKSFKNKAYFFNYLNNYYTNSLNLDLKKNYFNKFFFKKNDF